MSKIIGIIGIGDLGSRLLVQILVAGYDVIIFDKLSKKNWKPGLGVDPNLEYDTKNFGKLILANSIDEVISKSKIIHWAIQSSSLPEFPEIDNKELFVILHDSVMNNSIAAISKRKDANQFSIVHCLVNDAKRVFVANNNQMALSHFHDIGLVPQSIAPHDHDRLLAHSQGMLAKLVKMGIKSELEIAFVNGNLTPSGEELYKLLKHRELTWTKNTLSSILKNPELHEIINNFKATGPF